MDEVRQDADDELIERYLLGELSHEQKRMLQLRSLQDQRLFDALMANSLVEANRTEPVFRSALNAARDKRRSRYRSAAWGLAIAAGLALCGLYVFTPRAVDRIERVEAPSPVRAAPHPALEGMSASDGPVVLAGLLTRQRSAGEPFRGGGDSRTPGNSGEVQSADGNEATVSLGSQDGIEIGDRLRVTRQGSPVGQLIVTHVFRDRSRGTLTNASPGDRVMVEPARHLQNLLNRAEESLREGDISAALRYAQSAKSLTGGSRAWEWKANEVLGRAFAFTGKPIEAANSFESALKTLPAGSPVARRAALLEALAAVRLVSNDAVGAAHALNQLESTLPSDPGFEGRKLNAQAILAELQGDTDGASRLYGRAQASVASPAERDVVRRNAARLKEPR